MNVQPRLIRIGKAPAYLGMDRALFDELVRPHLTIIPIGIQGKAVDRLDLDAWADDYKKAVGVQPSKTKGERQCNTGKCQVSSVKVKSGTSRRGRSTPQEGDFEKALGQLTMRKRNVT